MLCGHCKEYRTRFSNLMLIHWEVVGCPWGRDVWARVFELRAQGHSGRRLLHEAWPDLYPSEPMTEEDKERLRKLEEERKAKGIKVVKVNGRRWVTFQGEKHNFEEGRL